jgi:hypothetical protein
MGDNITKEILHFEIETGSALSEQEKLKAAIINLKVEAQNLQKAFKDGQISLQEYASESVRVENTQKSLVNTYSIVQRSVTGIKNPIKELTESNKQLAESNNKIAESAKEQVKELNVAGISVGNVASEVAKFANPVTGAIAVVGLLTEAYKESAVGAIDLREATGSLKSTFDILSNDLGNASGGGFFSLLAKGFSTAIISIKAAKNSTKEGQIAERETNLERVEAAEFYLKKLRETEVEQIKLDKENADRKDKAFKDQVIRDDKLHHTDEERQEAAKRISEELQERTKAQNELDEKKIRLLVEYGKVTGQIDEKTLKAVDEEGELNLKILRLETAISQTKADNGRKITQALLAESRITEEKQKQLLAEKKIFEKGKFKSITPGGGASTTQAEDEISQLQKTEGVKLGIMISAEDQIAAYRKLKGEQEVENDKKTNDKIADQHGLLTNQEIAYDAKVLEAKQKAADIELAYLGQTAAGASRLFKQGSTEQKVLASDGALIATYETAQKSADAVANIPYAGPGLAISAFAAAIASGLANVAAINGVTFSGGGYTGPGGKYQPAGIVHAGEVVWNQRDVAMAGGPIAANSMRPSYANGGIVANASTTAIDQQLAAANSFKNIPPLFVGVKEFVRVQDRVTAKEKATTI